MSYHARKLGKVRQSKQPQKQESMSEKQSLEMDLAEKKAELESIESKIESLEEKRDAKVSQEFSEKQQTEYEGLEEEKEALESEIEDLEGELNPEQESESKPSTKKLYDLQYDTNAGFPRFRGFIKPFDPSKPAMHQEWEELDEDQIPEEKRRAAIQVWNNKQRIKRIEKVMNDPSLSSPDNKDRQLRLIERIKAENVDLEKKLKGE